VSVNSAGLQDAERCCNALDSCNECAGECEPG
jgi:hypothetical protein